MKNKPEYQTVVVSNKRKLSQIVSLIGLQKGEFNHCIQAPSESTNMFQNLRLQIQKTRLGQYFENLHCHITPNHAKQQKKHNQVQSGLYILVKGKICFVWSPKSHDLQKKQYLFSIAKSGIFSVPSNHNSFEGRLEQVQSFAITQPFSVFQCEYGNCMALQDSILIKIDNQLRAITRFDSLFSQRQCLLQNCHLNGVINQHGALFSVATKLYSTLRRHQFYFHNIIALPTIAIVESGVIKLHRVNYSRLKNKFQMEKYALMMPGLIYEVVSTEASILAIEDNPTLCYRHEDLLDATKLEKLRFSKSRLTQGNINISSSLHLRTTGQLKETEKSKINKRSKKLAEISKKFQNELIISMHSCSQGLAFSETQNKKLKQTIDKCMPKALFDYSKYSPVKSVKTFEVFLEGRAKQSEKQERLRKRRQRKTFNQNFLDRYRNVSKELYAKFRQRGPENSNKGIGNVCLQISGEF